MEASIKLGRIFGIAIGVFIVLGVLRFFGGAGLEPDALRHL
jgi:hypothetical protein